MSSGISDGKFVIQSGEGITQGIKRELGLTAQQCKELGSSVWQEIINEFEAKTDGQNNMTVTNNAEKTPDKSNNFLVHAGAVVEFSRTSWQKIVNLVNNKLHTTFQTDSDTQGKSDNKGLLNNATSFIHSKLYEFEQNFEKSANRKIKESLIQQGITTKEQLEELAEKGSIEADEVEKLWAILSDNEIDQCNEPDSIELTKVKDAMNEGDMNKFKQAYHDYAKDYISAYDSDGDGKISVEEFILMEEKELGRALTPEERKVVQAEAENRIAILNHSDNPSETTAEDVLLDENEIAAYLWAMSKINDGSQGKTADDITFNEFQTVQQSMGILSGYSMTKTDNDSVKEALSLVNKSGADIDALFRLQDYTTLTNLSAEEQNKLKKGITIMNNNGITGDDIKNYLVLSVALDRGYENLRFDLEQ